MNSESHPLNKLIKHFQKSVIDGLQPKLSSLAALLKDVNLVRGAKIDELMKIRETMTLTQQHIVRFTSTKMGK